MNTIPESPDILVVGGGSAGIAAAVSASNSGASTVLVEERETLGGLATSAWVGTICGLFFQGREFAVPCCTGFPSEFGSRLAKIDDVMPQCTTEGLWFLPYRPSSYDSLAEMTVADAKVFCLKRACALAAEVDRDTIVSVLVTAEGKSIRFHPKAVIDCTGNSAVSDLAGIATLTPECAQANALVFELSADNFPDSRTVLFYLLSELQQGVIAGVLPENCQRVSLVPGHTSKHSILLKLGVPATVSEKKDAEQLVSQIVAYLQAGSSLLRTIRLEAIAPCLGIRSGRRLRGQLLLTRNDVLSCKRFRDGIAFGAWPIEEWVTHKRPKLTYLSNGKKYEIPARALTSSDISNLFSAGKAFSADDGAIASARVIGTCFQTGWAAGQLAVGSLRGNGIEETVAKIRREILAIPASFA